MPPKEGKSTNFKTYEAQLRLLAAIVASMPQPWKFDFKEIHKLFGESTPDGISWQMRAVKQGANVLKTARDNGEDPVAAFTDHLYKGDGSRGAGTPATPKHRTTSLTKRARSAGKAPASGTTPASKRRKADVKAKEEWEDDEDSPEVDYDELDTTPTKLKPKVLSTPRKFPPLLPHEAWKNPEPGSRPAAKRHVPIAPAPPRPAAPSYNLAPIPGVSSAAGPNVYTNPSDAVGYHYSPQTSMANSPAMDMNATNAMRRGSVVSVSSGNEMFNPFDAASPSASASDANTPQTVASSNAMMMADQQAAAPAQSSSSIKAEDYISPEYAHFASYAANGNGNDNDGGNGSVYGFDFNNQAQDNGHVECGGWQQDAQGYEDAGDC
ncbi:uncharacterized protein B0T15DRAFT_118892 [Chaetomium strumarium]|uniref:Uncharacterized protein n=1 Tax=Chaetomium strumarium TaxID=1170767 RepID=A0AAJ0M4S8_9PEZI|nr:hypothetical protein B0T15DRAFT_118892 [Chaetomium strumarium]